MPAPTMWKPAVLEPKKGTYTLSVTDVAYDDFVAGTGTTGVVAVGGSGDGRDRV